MATVFDDLLLRGVRAGEVCKNSDIKRFQIKQEEQRAMTHRTIQR